MGLTLNNPPIKSAELTLDLAQDAGTYDLGTASGDVLIEAVVPFLSVAATGLTSVALATDNGTPDALLASTLLASLGTAGTNLAPFTGRIVLPAGKKIQGTIVGTGTAGVLRVAVVYHPLSPGATLF